VVRDTPRGGRRCHRVPKIRQDEITPLDADQTRKLLDAATGGFFIPRILLIYGQKES